MAETEQTLNLLTLPPEIREEIYRLILHPNANRRYHEDEYTSYDFKPALVLFRINRQIYLESRKVFRELNTFVRIETPWAETQQHVQLEGHVPIVVNKDRAYNFEGHTMNVLIDAPHHMSLELNIQRFIILLDDLEKFTRMWHYADLTYPGLNEHLRLELQLRDPYAPDWEEKRMTKALQRRLLLPFGDVKNVNETVVGGDIKPYQAIEKELRELQSKPHLSPEHCLRESTRLKLEGNAELKEGRYREALELYNQAWHAIHVVIKGRKRHIHGDAFFGRELREEPFVGKNGQAERLLLRVQLVANTCLAYLKLEEWDQCRFWGHRSISMLREAMGADDRMTIIPEEEAVLGFPAADQMGKIYYRTAVACKMLEDESEARKLLRVAAVYLPRDENIRREIAATALRLG
ncbi:hypothetical protein M409DRAFT_26334 [Zasmidium cellare ATCC 36951]|uniref:Uncharacterized protein n=1 Tax=Zasmidium cellare ATCC 36951 TaxID=1080233 RepID=A0A6A6C8Y1_ZASCE|nr:uncharacterized protein M409DRAFT_26334 [Zasmidium cellare ATCC 36951]KAF2163293.1 hypothetical protein M409DRAFT_26334 [Zasmidium cellare ATCC 36951]